MAVVQNTDDEQKSTQMQENPTLGGGQSSTLGQSVRIPQQQSAGADKRGSGMGTRLSNLRKYVEANRGSGMADKIESGIKDIRTGVETGISQSQAKLQEQAGAEKSRLTAGEQLVKSSQEGGKGLFEQGKTQYFTQDITPKVEQEVPSFQDYGKTAEERLGTFEKYKAGQVEQLAIENEQKLISDLENLQKRADLSQTEAGRYQLLRETFQRPGYTTGQQRLDQLILQADPEQARQLKEMTQNIATPAQQSLQELQALKEAEQKAITDQATGLSSNIKKQLFGESGQPVIDPATGQIKEVGGVLGQFQSDLDNRVAQAREVASIQYSQLGDIIRAGGDITPDMLQKLGVTDQAKMNEFIDYYKRGQGQTLGQKIEAGGNLTEADANILKLAFGIEGTTADIMKAYQSSPDFRKAIQQGLAAVPELSQYRSEGPELNYAEYLRSLSPEAITYENVATQEDYARQAALKSLAGLEFGPLVASRLNEAGTYGDLGVGRFGIDQALAQAREYYNSAQYDTMGRVTAPDTQLEYGIVPTIVGVEQDVIGYADKGTGAVSAATLGLGDKAYQTGIEGAQQAVADLATPAAVAEQGIYQLASGDLLGGATTLAQSGLEVVAVPSELASTVLTTGTQMGQDVLGEVKATAEKYLGEDISNTLGIGTAATAGNAALSAVGTTVADPLALASAIARGDIDTILSGNTLQTITGINAAQAAVDAAKVAINSAVKAVISAPSKVISNAVSSVSKAVKKIFCFTENQLVDMADGSKKLIQDIKLGDVLKFGGKVYSLSQSVVSAETVFDYNSVLVTESHPVFENGKFVRVGDSLLGKPANLVGNTIVYSLCNDNHRIVINDVIFSDYDETDYQSTINDEESLELMNLGC